MGGTCLVSSSHENWPSPKLLEKIGATNLTLADAVAQIVANSFDAALDGEPTVVDVKSVDRRESLSSSTTALE